MTTEIETYIKHLIAMAQAPRTHQLSKSDLASINAGISALKVISDGNYQLTPTDQQRFSNLTKAEVIATLRALANIIEKGEI